MDVDVEAVRLDKPQMYLVTFPWDCTKYKSVELFDSTGKSQGEYKRAE